MLPSAVYADVRQVHFSMFYSTDPVTDEFMDGAKTLLDGVFSGEGYSAIANKALNVVQVLVRGIVGSGEVQTGASHQSMKIHATEDHPEYISAAFTQVEQCSAKDWKTERNFFLSYYAFVVWSPVQLPLRTIRKLGAMNDTAFTLTG